MHGPRDFTHDLARALESDVARKANGEIGKVAVAGAADASALNLNHAIYF